MFLSVNLTFIRTCTCTQYRVYPLRAGSICFVCSRALPPLGAAVCAAVHITRLSRRVPRAVSRLPCAVTAALSGTG